MKDTKSKYYMVRKVSWDSLWHAVFKIKGASDSWDRVTEKEALKISKKLVYEKNDDVVK